jgi:hypothetical protein
MNRNIVKGVKQSKVMIPSDCPYWNRCSAPFCPIENNNCVWFSDEEVCHRKDIPNKIVKKQTEIKRKSRGKDNLYEITNGKMHLKPQ